MKPLLERVGYTFVNAQVGIELGHPNWFVFFVRAGISRVWLSVNNAQKVATSSASSGDVTVKSVDDPRIRLGIPNAKVGIMFYFY
jgi:hypothetical protein